MRGGRGLSCQSYAKSVVATRSKQYSSNHVRTEGGRPRPLARSMARSPRLCFQERRQTVIKAVRTTLLPFQLWPVPLGRQVPLLYAPALLSRPAAAVRARLLKRRTSFLAHLLVVTAVITAIFSPKRLARSSPSPQAPAFRMNTYDDDSILIHKSASAPVRGVQALAGEL